MIKVDIETRLPTSLRLSNVNRYLVEGWVFGTQRIKALTISIGSEVFDADELEIFRPDVFRKHGGNNGLAAFSGFSVPVILSPVDEEKKLSVTLNVAFKDGGTLCHDLGAILLAPAITVDESRITTPDFLDKKNLLTICMATYNPEEKRFRIQIDSIVAQEFTNWICIVCDDCSEENHKEFIRKILAEDRRFIFIENTANVGFYHNFERCLELVPKFSKHVALADQDDRWYPNKLSKCLEKLTGNTQLVYSDMRIVSENGAVLSETYWKNRQNYYSTEDIDLLALANTVTGAASVFCATLLKKALPFPPRYGDVYHDQWLAVISAASGGIDYVAIPLYDYIQSGANVIGHYDFKKISVMQFIKSHYFFQVYRSNRYGYSVKGRAKFFIKTLLQWAQNLYNFRFMDGKQIMTIVNTARTRNLDENIVSKLGNIMTIIGLLKIRHKVNGRRISVNNNDLSMLFSRLFSSLYKVSIPLLSFFLSKPISSKKSMSYDDADRVDPSIVEFKRKFSGRKFELVEKKQQVNLLLPSLDPANFFGGYIGMFNFAKKFAEVGYSVRIVITDQREIASADLIKIQNHDQTLKPFLCGAEFVTCFNEAQCLPIAADDLFIATSWWTAHIAHEAVAKTRCQKFIFLEQDYEPVFYEHGAYRVLSEMSYQYNFFPFFSTDILQKYFFETGKISPGTPCENFRNPVLDFKLTVESIRANRREKKKLLFYGRPQPHNARNLYPIGCLALDYAGELGFFRSDEWEVIAIGGEIGEQILPSGILVRHIGKFDIQQYKELLPQHDLGLALMDSPHPSLLPIEMASAGLLVVTNTYGIKDSRYFSNISENITAASPSYKDLAQALIELSQQVGNFERRVAGSKVNWPHDWNEALPEAAIRRAISAVVGS